MSLQSPLSAWFVSDKWLKKLSIHVTSCDFIIQTPKAMPGPPLRELFETKCVCKHFLADKLHDDCCLQVYNKRSDDCHKKG